MKRCNLELNINKIRGSKLCLKLYKYFINQQDKSLLESYFAKEVKINYILEIVRIIGIKFFFLLAKYWKDSDKFFILKIYLKLIELITINTQILFYFLF